MNFELSTEQNAIRDAIASLMADFGDEYWLARERDGAFPDEFYEAIVAGGWLGIAVPETFGGSALGLSEAAVMMMTVADSAGGMSAASAIHMNIFGPRPIAVFGTHEQKTTWLPPLIAGKQKCCFAVTEPDAGLDTGSIKTAATRTNDGYVISGQKVWTSTAQVADKMILLARTTPAQQCERPIDGLSLFYTDLNREYIEVTEIEKMGRRAVDSNALFIDELPVPQGDLVGEEGKGFRYILQSLNSERILIGAEALGLGRNALARAARYARERTVFGRPIGQNQAIQHPLAQRWIDLEAGELLCLRAAWAYDEGLPCGPQANACKFFCAEAGYKAAEQAVLTLGGMGYAKEFHVERLMREAMIPRLAPVSAQLVLCYIAERVLDLPKSY